VTSQGLITADVLPLAGRHGRDRTEGNEEKWFRSKRCSALKR